MALSQPFLVLTVVVHRTPGPVPELSGSLLSPKMRNFGDQNIFNILEFLVLFLVAKDGHKWRAFLCQIYLQSSQMGLKLGLVYGNLNHLSYLLFHQARPPEIGPAIDLGYN